MIILFIAIAVIAIIGLWKVFEKAGEPGWAAIVPVYNIIILLKVAGQHWAWVFIALIPYAGSIVLCFIAGLGIAKNFGKSAGFGVGLALLGFVFYPILGFDDSTFTGKKVF